MLACPNCTEFRMWSGQRHILYITGRTKRDAARSPYIEAQLLHEMLLRKLRMSCVKIDCPTLVVLADCRRQSCENKQQQVVIIYIYIHMYKNIYIKGLTPPCRRPQVRGRVGGRDRRCLTLGCGRVGRVWGRRKGCGRVCRVWGRDRPCLTLLSEPVKRKKRKSLASKKIVFGLREKRTEKERYLRDFLPGNSLQTNRACGSVCRVGGRDRRCLTLGCGRVGRVWGRRKGCGRVCRVWGRDRPCLTLLSEPVKRKKRKSLAS